ncbi:hypothetical protein [Burkholderia ubonensis]|uniref:hypothetical protein n=1 Tax=Burkholderia ubonensis TaxID=101571 RepID=UPI0012F81794|nr:hypothetical protein [Burkholderia ubonensis]
MDRDEELLSQVVDALTRALGRTDSGTATEACEALLNGCRRAAHAIIDRHSGESVRACWKSLYDVGAVEGLYGRNSAIAAGLMREVMLQCGNGDDSLNRGSLVAALIHAGRLHGRTLNDYFEGRMGGEEWREKICDNW